MMCGWSISWSVRSDLPLGPTNSKRTAPAWAFSPGISWKVKLWRSFFFAMFTAFRSLVVAQPRGSVMFNCPERSSVSASTSTVMFWGPPRAMRISDLGMMEATGVM